MKDDVLDEQKLEARIADDDDFRNLKEMCDRHDGWNLEYTHLPMQVWTRPAKDSTFNMIKVVTVFKDVEAGVLYDVLHDPDYRTVWDKHMIQAVDVGYLNPNNDVSYYAISCPAPMKNRDFILLRSWLDTEKELYILNHSVHHQLYPPKKGFVRGFSYLTGYLMRPLASGGCSLSYVSHCDPRGKLPPWLINKLTHVFAPKMIKTLHKVSLQYPAWKQIHRPYYKPWIFPEQINIPRITLAQLSKPVTEEQVQSIKVETRGKKKL